MLKLQLPEILRLDRWHTNCPFEEPFRSVPRHSGLTTLMELETVMERPAILVQGRAVHTDHLSSESLPGSMQPRAERSGFHKAVAEFKRSLIENTLRQTEWNRTRAAKFLGLQRTYLLRLMRDLRVTVPPPRRNGRSPLEPKRD